MYQPQAKQAQDRIAHAIDAMRDRRDLDAHVIAHVMADGETPSEWIIRAWRRRDAALTRLRAARDAALVQQLSPTRPGSRR